MAENNNNGGKNTNIITKINDTISKVLGDFRPLFEQSQKSLSSVGSSCLSPKPSAIFSRLL